ncbi:unnamed protein product [Ophioblennius macclurei]
MSASWPGIMRGPRLKTLLVLLLLLLTTLTESVVCQEEEEDNAEPDADAQEEEQTEETGGDDGTTETETVPSPAPDPVDTEGEPVPEDGETQTSGDEGITPISTSPTYSDKPTDEPEGEQDLNIIMILLPVVLVLLIGMILCGIFVRRRWKQKGGNQDLDKEDQYLDGSSTEKVPMPMFEEDVPSVLELEMEELDQWMKKDNGTADDSHHA